MYGLVAHDSTSVHVARDPRGNRSGLSQLLDRTKKLTTWLESSLLLESDGQLLYPRSGKSAHQLDGQPLLGHQGIHQGLCRLPHGL